MAGIRLPDSQSGFRVFGQDVAKLELRAQFTYTQEQALVAAMEGFPVTQLPISFGVRLSGESRLVKSPLAYLARVFADLDRIADARGLDMEHQKWLPIEG
jgi:hypothetical protein